MTRSGSLPTVLKKMFDQIGRETGEPVPTDIRRELAEQALAARIEDELIAMDVDDVARAYAPKVEALRNRKRPQPRPRSDSDPDALVPVPDVDNYRQGIISIAVAERAAQDEDVINVRNVLLDGDTFATSEAAVEWIEMTAEEEGPGDVVWTVVIDTPEANEALTNAEPWSGPVTMRRAMEPTAPLRYLRYINPTDNWIKSHRVVDRGRLDHLRIVSERLAKRYAWTEAQATMWLLTGRPPWVGTFRTTWKEFRYPRTITMEVDPELSPEFVAKVYRRARRDLLRGAGAITAKAAKAAYLRVSSGSSWRELYEEWNREHPDPEDPYHYTSKESMQSTVRQTLKRIYGVLWDTRGR